MKLQNKKDKANQISELISQGLESWVKAGEIVVEMIDIDCMSISDIEEMIPAISSGVIGRFEQLGRKQILPNLLVSNNPSTRYLSQLPYSEQKRLMSESIEVVTEDGDKILISHENLTSFQSRQVFKGGSIRSLSAQRAWIESEKSKRKQDKEDEECLMPYTIKGKSVTFTKGAKLDASQLANLLANLTK